MTAINAGSYSSLARPDKQAPRILKPVSRRDSLLKRLLTPAPAFDFIARDHGCRPQAEQYIRDRYQHAYQAEVSHFYPWLLAMRCLGTISGIAGIRPADDSPMFLEQYLDAPIEQLLQAHRGLPVRRSELVEIGNLVASQRGTSHLLFLLFTAILHRAGYQWIVFTATRSLRNNLEKLGFPLQLLGSADMERIASSERAAWGSYYDTHPQVVAGSLQDAMDIIQSRPLLNKVLRMYRYDINYLAEELAG